MVSSRRCADVRRRDLRLRIEALRIAIAHVIDEDDDDVGFLHRHGKSVGAEQQKEERA